jgi:5-methylcytosine-specific restriction endonuclease McrA
MLENEFYNWLLNQKGYEPGTANSRKSNCLRVEQFEGDLDVHFEKDKCGTMLDKLIYTGEDASHNRPPKHGIPINGNRKTGTATLKHAVELYTAFKTDMENGVIVPYPGVQNSNRGEERTPSFRHKAVKNNSRYRGNAIGNAQNLLIRNILSNLGSEAFNEDDWKKTIAYFNNKCAYCGSDDKLVMDHAIPINKEKLGEHRIGNLIPSCEKCNSAKADKDYKEFLKNNIEALEKIETYMFSKNYIPLENNEQLKNVLNMAHQEVADVAKRYIELINDLFINGKEGESCCGGLK